MTQGLFRIEGFGELSCGVATHYGSKPHFHDGYSLGFFEEPVSIWCRGRLRSLRTGEFVVLEPGEVHGGRGDANHCRQDGMILDPAWTALVFGNERPVEFPDPVIRDPHLRSSFTRGLSGLDAARLRSALVELFARFGVPVRVAPEAAVQSIPADPALPVSLQARKAHLSRSHFSRRVRAATGLCPRDYRRLRRVHQARALIEMGWSLADAAADAGFADQAHMTRQFRQICGVTPAMLRPPPF
jgi:AraC-like DNA-binding protein